MKFNTPKLVDRFLRTKDVLGPETTISPLGIRSGISPVDWFVDAQKGSDAATGLDPRTPKATLATLIGNGASSLANSGDTIYVVGNVTEEVTAYNLLEDITIIGMANRPRHADKARDYATYAYRGISGASWRQAASHTAVTPLLTVRGQGWRVENILFAPPSDAAAIFLARNALSNVSEYDASHFEVTGCRFDGGQNAIDVTDCYNVHIDGNTFRGQTAASIMSTGAGVAQPLMACIENNQFMDNDTHISVAYTKSVIRYNTFGLFATLSIDLTDGGAGGGGDNMVYGNALSGTYSALGGYVVAAASDEWGGNFNSLAGGVTAADPG